jgi:hypothetical protein
MQIIKIDKEEYKNHHNYFRFLYNKTLYLDSLPKNKEFAFFKIVDHNSKTKFLFFTINNNSEALKLPNPAPYWCLESVRKQEKPEVYSLAIKLVKKHFLKTSKAITITLPPFLYDHRYVGLITKLLLDEKFYVKHIDYNHHLDVSSFHEDEYLDNINTDARRNLKIANKESLQFKKLKLKEYDQAYEVIKSNRKAKSYPLKLTKTQMLNNLSNFNGDVFAVFKDSFMVASALIFSINDNVKQLIYWGDLTEYSKFKPMNYLAFEILKYYENKSIHYIDLGPSSDEGEINSGLSNFKESIGAHTSLKFTLIYKS